jgi:hypothetical protein
MDDKCKTKVFFIDTGVCSSTDRASDYGSEGWGFESLQAHEYLRS